MAITDNAGSNQLNALRRPLVCRHSERSQDLAGLLEVDGGPHQARRRQIRTMPPFRQGDCEGYSSNSLREFTSQQSSMSSHLGTSGCGTAHMQDGHQFRSFWL